MREWRSAEVARALRVPYRQLDYWDRTQLVSPSVSPASGEGSRRLYSDRDVAELALVVRLLRGGLTLQTARRAIAIVQAQHDGDLSGMLVVARGGLLVHVVENAGQLRRLVARERDVFHVVSLDQLIPATAAAR